MIFLNRYDLVGHCNEHGTARLPSAVSADQVSPHHLTSDKKGKLVHKCELCYKAFASEERLSVRKKERKKERKKGKKKESSKHFSINI